MRLGITVHKEIETVCSGMINKHSKTLQHGHLKRKDFVIIHILEAMSF